MPSTKQGILSELPIRIFALGKSDTASVMKAFSMSPLYRDYTDTEIREAFTSSEEVRYDATGGRTINDRAYNFGTVNVDYQEAPDLTTDVPVGINGLPASPYGPNISVRSIENTNELISPQQIELAIASTLGSVSAHSGVGIDSPDGIRRNSRAIQVNNTLVSPSRTSRNIGRRTLGVSLKSGEGSGNTFRNRE